MKILALELSSTRGSVAISGEEAIEESWPNERRHSGIFFKTLELLRVRLGSADVVVAGLGPGSYAGIRIAAATAIGLSTAWHARLVGAPSICAMEGDETDFCVIGDARRNGFYFAEVRNRKLRAEPSLLAENELRAVIERRDPALPVFSTEPLPRFAGVEQRFPSAAELVRLAVSASVSPA